MLIFWCMVAVAALLLYLKIQTLMENRKRREAEKAQAAAEKQQAQAAEKNTCRCEDTARKE